MPTRLPRLAGVVLAVSFAVFPTSAQAKPSASEPEPIIEKINEVRASHRLRPFKYSPALGQSSGSWAKRLMRADAFSHGNPIQAKGRFSRRGEALAYSSGWRLNRGSIVRMWLNSPAHRALLLSRSFRYVGAGKARGRFNGALTTIWVLQLGAR